MTITDEDEPCTHEFVENDDDGQGSRFFRCLDCHRVVFPSVEDDGRITWETAE